MKRSEFKRQISEKGFAVAGYLQSGPISDTLAEEILGELEMRVGWRWEPEEEPLPEMLSCGLRRVAGWCVPGLLPAGGGKWTDSVSEVAAYDEAVRRYNAWPALRKNLVEIRSANFNGSHLIDDLLDELESVLKGKEPSS